MVLSTAYRGEGHPAIIPSECLYKIQPRIEPEAHSNDSEREHARNHLDRKSVATVYMFFQRSHTA